MENVGSDPAENINVYISTTDPYIFSTGSETLTDPIDANDTGSTVQGVQIQISDYVRISTKLNSPSFRTR